MHLTWVDTKAFRGFKKFYKGKVYYVGRDHDAAVARMMEIMTGAPASQPMPVPQRTIITNIQPPRPASLTTAAPTLAAGREAGVRAE